MKISNKILKKILFFIPIYFLIAGIVLSLECRSIIQNNYSENNLIINPSYPDLNTINNAIIILCFMLVIISVLAYIYIIKTDKLIKKIKKYRDFMLATNNFTIDEISQEFGESVENVEKNIKTAIDKHILKKVYFSNKDKRIYILDSKNKTSNINLDYNYNLNMKINEENKK